MSEKLGRTATPESTKLLCEIFGENDSMYPYRMLSQLQNESVDFRRSVYQLLKHISESDKSGNYVNNIITSFILSEQLVVFETENELADDNKNS